MDGPKRKGDYPERLLRCEEDLEVAFNLAVDAVVLKAVEAGWDLEEAEEVVLSLAQSRRWVQLTSDEADEIEDTNVVSINDRKKH
ncbi:conserved hypothetical protein [Rhizobium sp. EC-SD404]|nr:conserved hypothetical protein [Rhizobium sp. EC-SD404]